MPFDKTRYDIEYAKANVTRKFLQFNKNDPEDMALIAWLDSQGKGNMNAYVKGLIATDMHEKNGDSMSIRLSDIVVKP